MKRPTSVGGAFLLFLCSLVLTLPGRTQPLYGNAGVLRVTDWPESTYSDDPDAEKRVMASDFLVSLDTLSLGYGFRNTADRPHLMLALEWKAGPYGILDGKRLPIGEMPDSIHMVGAVFRADVVAKGEVVTTLTVAVDSMMLGPAPDLVDIEVSPGDWGDVFDDLSAAETRELFEKGFELRDLTIVSVGFAAYGQESVAAESDSRRRVVTMQNRRPSHVGVYRADMFVDVVLHLDWLFYGGRVVRDRPVTRPNRLRGDEIGRGDNLPDGRSRVRGVRRDGTEVDRQGDTRDNDSSENLAEGRKSGRSVSSDEAKKARGRRSSDDKKDEDDEKDEKELLPAALAAAAVVGIVAYGGGSIGYFGNTEHTPIGLSAGYIRPAGGFLLQAAINAAVLDNSGDVEKLLVRATAFRRVFDVPLQPAIGAGVLASGENGEVDLVPSLSVGLVGNFGPAVIAGGYDVVAGGLDIGLLVNLHRYRR